MEKRLFFLISQVHSLMAKSADKDSLENVGIPNVQSATLLILSGADGSTLTEIRKILRINKSSMGALSERMERNDIIRRCPDEHDARVIRLYLTETGRSKIKKIKKLLPHQNEKLTNGFSEEELDVVYRFLNNVVDKLDNPASGT